jgi:hypothetical protein
MSGNASPNFVISDAIFNGYTITCKNPAVPEGLPPAITLVPAFCNHLDDEGQQSCSTFEGLGGHG